MGKTATFVESTKFVIAYMYEINSYEHKFI